MKQRPDRCGICGQFIGDQNFINNEIYADLYYDMHTWNEVIEFYHNKCLEKEKELTKRAKLRY
jgi:hypothetical protein